LRCIDSASKQRAFCFRLAIASMSIAAALDEVGPKVNALLADLEQSGEGKQTRIKTVVDKILEMALESGLAYKEKVSNAAVGVDPSNRYGDGLHPLDVHELLLEIAHQGWSNAEVQRACAAELLPGAAGQAAKDFNARLVANSDGLLAPLDPDAIRLTTVACSHTVAGLRVALFGARGVHKEICVDGFVSKERLMELSPEMRDPVENGITWTILRHQLVHRCPRLLHVVQEAGNIGHGIERKQTKVQTLLQIFARANAAPGSGDIDWKVLVKAIELHRPFLRGQCMDMAMYVQKWAGGEKGELLHELERFSKSLTLKRDIHASFFGALSKVELTQVALYVTAMIKAQMSCPEKYVKEGEARMLTSTDVSSISGRHKQYVLTAVKEMARARELVRASMLAICVS
jgi:hypothetical protein